MIKITIFKGLLMTFDICFVISENFSVVVRLMSCTAGYDALLSR